MNDDCAVPFMSEDTSSGNNSAYVPLKTKSNSVTVWGDRAVLWIMQIVTSTVRVFLYEMPLDIFSLSLSYELLYERRWAEAHHRSVEMLEQPSLPGLSDSQIVYFVGNGCALRHCRRYPRKARFDRGAEEEREFAALLL